ncbi:MAG: hypothetical protein IPG38_06700 [Chitinophagaceae bacterium]|nr:hypothetical protein [Chitinophagaceae bacterium]
MKKFLVFISLIFIFSDVFPAHITGVEMIYRYLGPGSTANTKSYRITLNFSGTIGGGAAMPGVVRIGIL